MLELVRVLTPEMLEQIAALETDSIAADGGRLKLEWATLTSRSGDLPHDLLWWHEDRVVGFLGVYAFGGPDVELAGMVHPTLRRGGIGSQLLDAALELSREREHATALLVVPRSSPGGRHLALQRKGTLHHSEYAMDLFGEAEEGASDPALLLRACRGDDVEAETHILADAFGVAPSASALSAPDETRLVGEYGGRVVATLRVHRSLEQWGVYGFAVDSAYRGHGIGRDLLRRVCRQAHGAGVKRVHLEVEVNNERALGLYTRLGFTQTSTEDYYSIPL